MPYEYMGYYEVEDPPRYFQEWDGYHRREGMTGPGYIVRHYNDAITIYYPETGRSWWTPRDRTQQYLAGEEIFSPWRGIIISDPHRDGQQASHKCGGRQREQSGREGQRGQSEYVGQSSQVRSEGRREGGRHRGFSERGGQGRNTSQQISQPSRGYGGQASDRAGDSMGPPPSYSVAESSRHRSGSRSHMGRLASFYDTNSLSDQGPTCPVHGRRGERRSQGVAHGGAGFPELEDSEDSDFSF